MHAIACMWRSEFSWRESVFCRPCRSRSQVLGLGGRSLCPLHNLSLLLKSFLPSLRHSAKSSNLAHQGRKVEISKHLVATGITWELLLHTHDQWRHTGFGPKTWFGSTIINELSSNIRCSLCTIHKHTTHLEVYNNNNKKKNKRGENKIFY